MKKIAFFLSILLFMGTLVANAQTRNITGTVTSTEDGQPIPGVSVSVKGTTLGTITSIDGVFEMKIPQDAKALVVSFVGMKTQNVELTSASDYKIALKPDLVGIDEVVVTAIGIERSAREVGYAMSSISDEQLNMAKSPTIAGGLMGKVAGLQITTVSTGVNTSQRVILRGNRSFTGNNQALLVLDGVPVSLSYLTSLNPNDVKEISILKGANASALYGSDAANGVIMVTTKQGSKESMQVQFSNTTTFDKVAYLPEFQTRFGTGSSSDKYGNPIFEAYENQQYGDEFDGKMRGIGRKDEYGRMQEVIYAAIPGEKERAFDTGMTIQNDLSFSAGDKKSTFFASIQDAVVKGLVPGDDLRRDAIRLNGSRKYKGFKATGNVNYTHTEDEISTANFLWPIYNTGQHIPLTSYSDWRTPSTPEKTNWADIDHYYNDYYNNPYTEKDKNRRKRRRDQLIGTLTLSQDITSWLNGMVRSSLSLNNSTYKTTHEEWNFSYWAEHESGRSTPSGGDKKASVSDGSSYDFRWTNDFILTANNEFEDFKLTTILGATTRSGYVHYINVSASALEVPGLYNISNRLGELGGSQAYYEGRTMGVFGDVTLGYKNFLFLHASGRNDWDSRLDPSQWSFFYPGVDVSFVFTEAIPALADNSVLSYGKLRGGIAKVGSINILPYSLENTFVVTGGFPYGDLTAHSISGSLKNRYLEPEFTLSKEIGMDLNFFESRINLEMAYYTMSTTNQTLPAEIPYSSGYSSMFVNAGEMKNSGVEVELGLVPVSTKDFRWDVNINYANWNSLVVSLTDKFDELNISRPGRNNFVYAIKGQPYPVNKASDFDRDPQGRVIVDAKTGLPTKSTDLVITGQTTPKHILGLQTYLRYKGFTAGISAEYRGGFVLRSGPGRDMMFPGISAISASAGRERFVFPNSVINVGTADNPEYVENTNITTNDGNVDFWTQTYRGVSRPFVTNAAFWKIRELSLYYDVPERFLTSGTGGFVKGIKAGFVGRNLFMFLPDSNMYGDPEANKGNDNDVGYAPPASIPPSKSYGFNVTITF